MEEDILLGPYIPDSVPDSEIIQAWEWFDEACGGSLDDWVQNIKQVRAADGCILKEDQPMCKHRCWNPLILLGIWE